MKILFLILSVVYSIVSFSQDTSYLGYIPNSTRILKNLNNTDEQNNYGLRLVNLKIEENFLANENLERLVFIEILTIT